MEYLLGDFKKFNSFHLFAYLWSEEPFTSCLCKAQEILMIYIINMTSRGYLCVCSRLTNGWGSIVFYEVSLQGHELKTRYQFCLISSIQKLRPISVQFLTPSPTQAQENKDVHGQLFQSSPHNNASWSSLLEDTPNVGSKTFTITQCRCTNKKVWSEENKQGDEKTADKEDEADPDWVFSVFSSLVVLRTQSGSQKVGHLFIQSVFFKLTKLDCRGADTVQGWVHVIIWLYSGLSSQLDGWNNILIEQKHYSGSSFTDLITLHSVHVSTGWWLVLCFFTETCKFEVEILSTCRLCLHCKINTVVYRMFRKNSPISRKLYSDRVYNVNRTERHSEK